MASCSCLTDPSSMCLVTDGYTLVNLTGAIVRIFDPSIVKEDGAYCYLEIGYVPTLFNRLASLIIKPDEKLTLAESNVQFISTQEKVVSDCGCTGTFNLYQYSYTGETQLPEKKNGTLYIVTEQVQKAFSYRTDFIVPYKPVKCSSTGTACPASTPAAVNSVVGYCGFYKPSDGSISLADPNTTIVLDVPDYVVGMASTEVKVPVKVCSSLGDLEPMESEVEIYYTPISCSCIDKSESNAVTTIDGDTRKVKGTVEKLNKLFEKFYCKLGTEAGHIEFVYGNRLTTTKTVIVDTSNLKVDWDNVTNKPEVVDLLFDEEE